MKREILFRGLSTELKKWVYGDLVHDCNRKPAINIEGYSAYGTGVHYRHLVESETIGQFTGLYSANHSFIERPNERAYFGDIIKFVTTEGTVLIKELSWSNELCCVMVGNIPYNKLYESGFIQPSKLEFEIIGNVHDNPELLKTE